MVKGNRLLTALNNRILVGDGAMGTLLQKYSRHNFSAPEELILREPGVVLRAHREYIKAGAGLIETNTFGANRLKLRTVGLEERISEINLTAVQLAKQAAGDMLVAASVGPTGQLFQPYGKLDFTEVVAIYLEQLTLLREGGVDAVLIETMSDLRELKSAVIAARQVGIPIIAQMTFNQNGFTLTGNTPEVVAITLDSLNVDVIGVNCVDGMDVAIPLLKRMAGVTNRPLSVFPNAGLPFCQKGETVFPGKPVDFIRGIKELIKHNVRIIGGCCGTTPEFITALKKESELFRMESLAQRPPEPVGTLYLSSSSDYIEVRSDQAVYMIGEKLNPTGRHDLKDALQNRNWSYLRKVAREQVEAGAGLLDVNIGLPDIKKELVMARLIQELQLEVNVPLVLDSTESGVLEAGLKEYAGKALINSVNGDPASIAEVMPLAARYGAAIIGLTLDQEGIPSTVEQRLVIARRILAAAEQYGIKRDDVIIDPLVLTVGARQKEVLLAIRTLEKIKEELGVKTTLGISNVSHGLPARNLINRTYLAMALGAGLDLPIVNPFNEQIRDTIRAANLLTGRDPDGKAFLQLYQQAENRAGGGNTSFRVDPGTGGETITEIKQAVLDGNQERISGLIEQAIKVFTAKQIIEQALIPAINQVGDLYDQGVYFLPQLIKGSETVQAGFDYLKEFFAEQIDIKEKATVLLATVAGDVHDLGKNIVKIVFANHGFRVIDLGSNIPSEQIVSKALEYQVDFVGLSALMTTTMAEMGQVIKLLKRKHYPGRVIIGGAVTTADFAREIGADFYAVDALDGVRKIINSLR